MYHHHLTLMSFVPSSPLTSLRLSRIRRLVKVLFFRLNLQELQAKKYKKKESSPNGTRDVGNGTIIDVDAINDGLSTSKSRYAKRRV